MVSKTNFIDFWTTVLNQNLLYTLLFHRFFVLGILNWVLQLFNIEIIICALSFSISLLKPLVQFIHYFHSNFFFVARGSVLFFVFLLPFMSLVNWRMCIFARANEKKKYDTKTFIRCTVFDQKIWIVSSVMLTRFHIISN